MARLHPPGRDCLAESLYSFFVHLLPLSFTLNHLPRLASAAGLLWVDYLHFIIFWNDDSEEDVALRI